MASTPAANTPTLTPTQPPNARTPNQNTTSMNPSTSKSTPQAIAISQETDPLSQFQATQNTIEPSILAIKPFPSASTFTFIPDLYNLISRLAILEDTPQFQGQRSRPPSSPLLSRERDNATAKQETSQASSTSNKVLELKDLPEHVYEIKQAIQNAREVVKDLPDINRTISEQEVEIDLLKSEIRGLRKRACELALLARDSEPAVKTEDVAMQGVEDG